MRDLPNLGEKERGVPSPQPTTPQPQQPQRPVEAQTQPTAVAPRNTAEEKGNALGWVDSAVQVVWEKWRWGLLIALAVIVSRVSSK